MKLFYWVWGSPYKPIPILIRYPQGRLQRLKGWAYNRYTSTWSKTAGSVFVRKYPILTFSLLLLFISCHGFILLAFFIFITDNSITYQGRENVITPADIPILITPAVYRSHSKKRAITSRSMFDIGLFHAYRPKKPHLKKRRRLSCVFDDQLFEGLIDEEGETFSSNPTKNCKTQGQAITLKR